MAPALRMTRNLKEKLPVFFASCLYFFKIIYNYLGTLSSIFLSWQAIQASVAKLGGAKANAARSRVRIDHHRH